jgi:hypothetical protein
MSEHLANLKLGAAPVIAAISSVYRRRYSIEITHTLPKVPGVDRATRKGVVAAESISRGIDNFTEPWPQVFLNQPCVFWVDIGEPF